jgi:hypothetical protein
VFGAGVGWPKPVPEKTEIPSYRFISYIPRNVFKSSVGNSDGPNLLLQYLHWSAYKINHLKTKINFMYHQF